MTVLPRVATTPELALMRLDNQSTRWYLTIDAPSQIYTARLAAVPSSTDQVASITYNTGAGVGGKTYADCLMDMTILVSAVGYGLYDLGEVRLRNTTGLGATSGTFNIGETSQVAWAANCYLTVIDEFALWPRHIKIASDGTTPLMDYDVPLGAGAANQNIASGAIPTPVLGPDAVLWKRGATVSFTPDASHSWVKDGTIASYAHAAPGCSSITNNTTATPTITYDTFGQYRRECIVTGDNGVPFTGYRRVYVVDETHGVTTQFTLDQPPTGDFNTGGWSARVTLYDEATLALVRDRAMVILHTVDYYGNTLGSIGYIPGCENIRLVGRIAGETITWGTEDKWGTVSFEIQGPQWWLGHMTAFPSGVIDTDTTPNKWTKFLGLTLNKALYHFMRWRSTATRMMDVFQQTDGRRHKRLEAPGGENIWAQLIEISTRSILAHPCCDRYGRFFDEIEQQLISDKSSIPIVQTISKADWIDEIRMDRVTVNDAALIDLSGVAWDGTTATPYFSLAPGHVFRHYGSVEVVDRLMLTAVQADTNTLAGLYSAWKNNPYPKIDVRFACNHHLIDIVPHQKLALAIAASDTPRGITESLTIIPRTIADDFDADLGAVLTTATFEAEVSAALAVTGDTPQAPPTPPPTPIVPPVDPPPIDPPPNVEAKKLWIIHDDPSTVPPVAIIYTDLSNMDAPVYNSIIPPAWIDHLYRGNYSPSNDTLTLIGHATATDPAPGWGGGAANVGLIVTGATTVSPTWTVTFISGFTDTLELFIGWGLNIRAGAGLRTISHYSSLKYQTSLSPVPILVSPCIGQYYCSIGNFYDNDYMAGGSDYIQITEGYATQIAAVFSGYISPFPNGYEMIGGVKTSDLNWMSDQPTYGYYNSGIGVWTGTTGYIYVLRSSSVDQHAQIVGANTLLIGAFSGGDHGTPITMTPALTLDELDNLAGSNLNPKWNNTFVGSNYCNVVITKLGNVDHYLYYCNNGVWGKMPGTIPLGYVHYLSSAGGVGGLWVADGAVANGNEFARYTLDLTLGTFVQMTGNMWSGGSKIITSGDLKIYDSWLSF